MRPVERRTERIGAARSESLSRRPGNTQGESGCCQPKSVYFAWGCFRNLYLATTAPRGWGWLEATKESNHVPSRAL